MTLQGVNLDDAVVKTATQRFSLTADNVADMWTLSAGLSGAVAAGSGGGGGGGSVAGSLAGSVSLNAIDGHTRARMIDSMLDLAAGDADSDVRVRATDDSDIFAVSGGLSLAVAKGELRATLRVSHDDPRRLVPKAFD